MRHNTPLMRYNLTGFVTQVCINTYIAILLSVIQGRTIYYLKKQFGSTFQKETTQISRVLVTFTVTFFIRAIYEACLGYKNLFDLKSIPSQFRLSMEVLINGFVSYQLPIGLIIYLHQRNSKSNLSNADRAASIYLTEE